MKRATLLFFLFAIAFSFTAAAQPARPAPIVYEQACPAGYSALASFGKSFNSLTGNWRANMCIAGDGSGTMLCQMIGCGTGINGLNFTGSYAFTGNNTHSGTEAFTGTTTAETMNGVLNAAMFPGSDIGAKTNAAYAALPSTGGEIYIPAGACLSFSTPIVFGTLHKPVTLRGAGSPATCLTYTGTTGVAITVNVGVQSRINRLEDFQLNGSGVGNATTGTLIGGSNDTGTESMRMSRMMITNFGLGLTFSGGNTFLFAGDQLHLNNNGQNFLSSVGAESNRCINCTFSLDTPGTTGTLANSVRLSNSAEWTFVGCSFDNAQISLATNATAHLFGGHMENPGLTSYDYFTMAGNLLDLTNVEFLQDNGSAFANNRFGSLVSGTLNLFGGAAFSPITLGSFVNLAGSSQFMNFGFRLNSTFTSGVASGSTTGSSASFPSNGSGDATLSGQFNGNTFLANSYTGAFISINSNPATAGIVRLNATDSVCWGTTNVCLHAAQVKRAVAGCTTAASIGGVCASPITVTWPVSFADTNYSVVCTPNGAATNLPSAPYWTAKAVGTATINYYAVTAAAASWPSIDCVAVHD